MSKKQKSKSERTTCNPSPEETALNPKSPICPDDWKLHEYTGIFPELSPADYEKLVRDIRDHGQLEPVLVLEGRLIDGRARVRACKELGRSPLFKILEPTTDALARILSANLLRRHLSTRERTLAAGRIANLKRGDVASQREAREGALGLSIDDAASLFKVSRSGVKRAKCIYESGDSSLIDKVEKGDLSLANGCLMATATPSEQPTPKNETQWAEAPMVQVRKAIQLIDAIPEEHPDFPKAFSRLCEYVQTKRQKIKDFKREEESAGHPDLKIKTKQKIKPPLNGEMSHDGP